MAPTIVQHTVRKLRNYDPYPHLPLDKQHNSPSLISTKRKNASKKLEIPVIYQRDAPNTDPRSHRQSLRAAKLGNVSKAAIIKKHSEDDLIYRL